MSQQGPPEFTVKEERCGTMTYTFPRIKTEKLQYSSVPDLKQEPEDRVPSQPIKQETAFLCPTCGADFYYERYFTEHVKEHHTLKASTVEDTVPDRVEKDSAVASGAGQSSSIVDILGYMETVHSTEIREENIDPVAEDVSSANQVTNKSSANIREKGPFIRSQNKFKTDRKYS